MTVGIELNWSLCPDGAEVLASEGAGGSPGRTVLTSSHGAKTDRVIRYRSGERRTYFRRIDSLNSTMLEAFINSTTDDGLVRFVSSFGLPGSFDVDDAEGDLSTIVRSRDAFRRLLDLSEANDAAACTELFNSLSDAFTGANLKPQLARWEGQATPMLTFQQRNPYGFMLMEAALAISNATSLRTCTHCGTAFLAGTATKKRTNAYYCSNRCRVAAQRARAAIASA